MIRRAYATEKEAARAGTWFAAVAGAEWALKRNDLPIVKAAAEGVNTSGGFLVPPELSAKIVELRDQRGIFRLACGGAEPMKSDSDSIPRRTGGLSAFF